MSRTWSTALRSDVSVAGRSGFPARPRRGSRTGPQNDEESVNAGVRASETARAIDATLTHFLRGRTSYSSGAMQEALTIRTRSQSVVNASEADVHRLSGSTNVELRS